MASDSNITLSSKSLLPFYDIPNKVMVLSTVLVTLSNMRISRHQSCFLEKLNKVKLELSAGHRTFNVFRILVIQKGSK